MDNLLYKSVANQIKQKIHEQEWTTKLPSEGELCKQFHVSRITLRHAIQLLCDEGLVVKRQGLGMFVERDDYDFGDVSTHSRLFSNVNEYRTLQVLRCVKPQNYLAHLLKLGPEDTVVEAQRLCLYRGAAASFLTVWIPEKYYKDGFFEDVVGAGFLIPAMKHLNLPIKRTVVTIEPLILKEKHPIIRVDKGEPVLFLRRVGFNADDVPVLVIEHLVDGKKSHEILKIHTYH